MQTATGEYAVVRPGDSLKGRGEVVAISQNRVILKTKDNETIFIHLEDGGQKQYKTIRTASTLLEGEAASSTSFFTRNKTDKKNSDDKNTGNQSTRQRVREAGSENKPNAVSR